MIQRRSISVPRDDLIAAIRPARLTDALEGLRGAGAIDSYEVRGGKVVITGDLTRLEAALELVSVEAPVAPQHQSARQMVSGASHTLTDQPSPADGRAEYFRIAREYTHSASFRNLPPLNRSIWRLHANGASWRDICRKLGVSMKMVTTAVRGARLAAHLATLTRPGRTATTDVCPNGCGAAVWARGMCRVHYLRRRRAGTLL